VKKRFSIDEARRVLRRATTQKRLARFALSQRAADADPGDNLHVEGHAAVFNTLSLPLYDWWEGRYVEQVAPGAFTKTLQEADVRMQTNHDSNLLLARTASGTLRLAEDNIGLFVDADMAPTTHGRDMAILLARGDVNQMSFMFSVVRDEWDETAEGTPRRTILECKLYDVAPVAFPAYEEADIGLRGADVIRLCRTLGLGDLPAEQRTAALAAFLGQAPTEDHLPALRAAQGALQRLVDCVEPAAAPLDRSDEPGMPAVVPLAIRRRQLALLAAREAGKPHALVLTV
jgi:HK97 family phage prohead protease